MAEITTRDRTPSCPDARFCNVPAPSDHCTRFSVRRRNGQPLPTHSFRLRQTQLIHLCMAGRAQPSRNVDYQTDLAPTRRPTDGLESLTRRPTDRPTSESKLEDHGPSIAFGARRQWAGNLDGYFPHLGKPLMKVCGSARMQRAESITTRTRSLNRTAISGTPVEGSWVSTDLGPNQTYRGYCPDAVKAAGKAKRSVRGSGIRDSCESIQGVQMHATGNPVHYVGGNPGGSATRNKQQIVEAVSRNRTPRRQRCVRPLEIATPNRWPTRWRFGCNLGSRI